jgi:hypothetical protein
MNSILRAGARMSLAGVCLGLSALAQATPVSFTSQTRVVEADRNLHVFDAAGHLAESEDPSRPPTNLDAGPWTQGAFTPLENNGIPGPDGTGLATGFASVGQSSLVSRDPAHDPVLLRFDNFGTASARGETPPGGVFSAHAFGLSTFDVTFEVTEATAVFMRGSATFQGLGGQFAVRLFDNGRPVFGIGPTGTEDLRLVSLHQGDHYRLQGVFQVDVAAGAFAPDSAVVADDSFGQGAASFVMLAAPEPQTWVLMLGGLAVVAWATRRRPTR